MTDIPHVKIFSAFSEKAKVLVFEIIPKNWFHSLMQRLKIKPKEYQIEVRPVSLGVRSILSTYVNNANIEKYSKETQLQASYLIAEHEIKNIVLFLAYIIWNKESAPPSWLIKTIRNIDQDGIDRIVEFAYECLDTQSFLNSIISMTGVSLQPVEIIAPEN